MPVTIAQDIKTIVWDLDGTLLDSFGIYCEIVRQLAPKYGLQPPKMSALQANFHGSLDESINAAFGGISEILLTDIVDDFLHVQNDYYEHINEHIFPDALALAKRLHAVGKKQLIVTNRQHVGREKASPRYILENSELCQYVDIVLCGDDGDFRKPNPLVLGDIALDSNATCVIGDQHVDAEFAANIGCSAIIVKRDSIKAASSENVDTVQSLDDVKL